MVLTTANRLRWRRHVAWAVLLCLSWTGLAIAGEHQLPERFDRLPYRLVEAVSRARAMPRVAVIDFDHDGIDEFVQSSVEQPGKYYYLVISHPAGDYWTPLQQISSPYPTGLVGICDVNLDGTPEIMLSTQVDGLLSVQVYEVSLAGSRANHEVVGGLAWDVGSWLYGDSWDGGLSVWGALDEDGDGSSATLVYTLAGGMSKRPRGVGVGNWKTGEMGWFAPTGAAPTEPTLLVDLTGDGCTEIVVPLGAPCNGVTEGTTTDTLSYVAAFTADGSQLWLREVGGTSSNPTIVVRDLDLDGVPEVLCAVRRGKATDTRHASLYVLRPSDGEPLAEWGFDQSVNAVATASDEDGPLLFAACADGILRRLRFSGRELDVEGGLDCLSAVSAVGYLDLDPFEESVISAVTAEGDVVVCDLNLVPLAALATGDPGVQGKYVEGAVLEDGIRCAYVATNDATYGFVAERGPPRIWPWLVVGLVAAVGAVVSVPRTRRAALSSLRRAVIPAADREEAVDELLAELST